MKSTWDQMVEQSEARGEARGRAAALLCLVRIKFGPPSAEDEARIRSADRATHERWTDRILTATSRDELFE